MKMEDFIVNILDEQFVVRLDNNRLEKVIMSGEDHIETEEGNIYLFYNDKMVQHHGDVLMSTLDMRWKLWTRHQWVRECKLNLFI